MDKETFWNHINPLQERLFRFALSILKDSRDAQDALHDILVKLWDKRHMLIKEKNIDAFALKTTKNYCIDLLRKRGRVLTVEQSSQTLTISPDYEQKDLIALIKKRSSQLPLQQRMIIELKDFQGYDYKEISEIMDIPIVTLRVNLSRARKFILKSISHEHRKI